jgi:hypothetical protein
MMAVIGFSNVTIEICTSGERGAHTLTMGEKQPDGLMFLQLWNLYLTLE